MEPDHSNFNYLIFIPANVSTPAYIVDISDGTACKRASGAPTNNNGISNELDRQNLVD